MIKKNGSFRGDKDTKTRMAAGGRIVYRIRDTCPPPAVFSYATIIFIISRRGTDPRKAVRRGALRSEEKGGRMRRTRTRKRRYTGYREEL